MVRVAAQCSAPNLNIVAVTLGRHRAMPDGAYCIHDGAPCLAGVSDPKEHDYGVEEIHPPSAGPAYDAWQLRPSARTALENRLSPYGYGDAGGGAPPGTSAPRV